MKIGFVALATLAFATSVSAATPAENPFAKDQAILTLKGLDLATAEGQQRLAIRLDQAARTVCGDRVAAVSLVMDGKARECRAAVVADVRSQIEARLALAPTAARVATLR